MPKPKQPTPLEHLRSICLALPHATEIETWENPTFRVRNKMFALYRLDSGHPDLWCKAAVGVQEDLIQADPKRFFAPPYVGPKGWIGVHLDSKPDWDFVAALVHDSYVLVAPKKFVALLEPQH